MLKLREIICWCSAVGDAAGAADVGIGMAGAGAATVGDAKGSTAEEYELILIAGKA